MSKSKFKNGDEVKFRRFYPASLKNSCNPASDSPFFGKVYRVSEISPMGTVFVEGITWTGFSEKELMFADIREEIKTGCFHDIETSSKEDRDKLEHNYRLACLELNNAYYDKAKALLDECKAPSIIETELYRIYRENETLLHTYKTRAEKQIPFVKFGKLYQNLWAKNTVNDFFPHDNCKPFSKIKVDINDTPDIVGDYFERISTKEIYKLVQEKDGYILRGVSGTGGFWHYHESELSKAFGIMDNGGRDKFTKIHYVDKSELLADEVGDIFFLEEECRTYTLKKNNEGYFALVRETNDGETTRAGWCHNMKDAFGMSGRKAYTKITDTKSVSVNINDTLDVVGDEYNFDRDGISPYTLQMNNKGLYAMVSSCGSTRCGWRDTIEEAFGIHTRKGFTKTKQAIDLNALPDIVGAVYILNESKIQYKMVQLEHGGYCLINQRTGGKWYSSTTLEGAFAPHLSGVGGRDMFTRIG